MKHLFTILLTLFSFYASGYAQKPFKVVFYNLENFFDLENDPDVLDDEFTPEGPKKWTKDKSATLKKYFSTLPPSTKTILP